ncbi:MAG: hypothetical protein Q9221_008007, partial [Calogaya cf. arnoldii]
MSFGWSASDLALLVRLAYKTSQGARAACGQYDELTRETTSLHVVLNRLVEEAAKPGNPISKDKSHAKEIGIIANGCNDVLTQLDKVLVKYSALSEQERSVRRLWKKIKFGNGVVADVAVLRSKITYYTSSLTLFLNMVSLGTIGNVEEKMDKAGGDLQDIKSAVNRISAHFMATAGEESSVLTAHTNNDRDAWRELRRRLLKAGFQDSLVRKHMDIIMAYVKELGDRGAFDTTNVCEAAEPETMAEPHREASPAAEFDTEGIVDDQDSPGPSDVSQQQERHRRDEQNTGYVSNTEGLFVLESADVKRKLWDLYGNSYRYAHRYETLKFVVNVQDRAIHQVDPSVSTLLEGFLFRYMSIISSGVSPVIEDFRGEAHGKMHLMMDTFNSYAQDFLSGMNRHLQLNALCNVFSVEMIRANDAGQSSIHILKDMKDWVERFDQNTQCRACVDARFRCLNAIAHSDWGGPEYMKALYGYPQVEDFATLRLWHDTHERFQTKASNLLKGEYQRYPSLQYSGGVGPGFEYYELPAFVADQTVVHRMDEVRAISDAYSIQNPKTAFNNQTRLFNLVEKQSVSDKLLNINTISEIPGTESAIYWTANGLAVLA